MEDHSRRSQSRSRSPSRNHRDKKDRSEHHSSSKHHHHKSHRHRHSDQEDDERRRKHRRDKDREETEEERKERKRAKKEKRRSEKGRKDELDVVDDDDDGGVWVEKDVDGTHSISKVPTADSLPLTSTVTHEDAPLPHSTTTGTQIREREAWMLDSGPIASASSVPIPSRNVPRSAGVSSPSGNGITEGYPEGEFSDRNVGGGVDFFSSLGIEHKRKDPNEGKPDPSKLVIDRRELNTQLVEGKKLEDYEPPKEKKTAPGGPGSQWRMMKLKRLYEQAEEQGRDVEDVAMERYGSLDDFNEALEERRILDEREQRRQQRRGGTNDGVGTSSPSTTGMRTPDAGGSGRRFMFTGEEGYGSRPSSRASFRRPGEAADGMQTPGGNRIEELKKREGGTPRTNFAQLPGSANVTTPIPSVFTPTTLARAGSKYTPTASGTGQPQTQLETTSKPHMSIEELNKLQAKVLRAKLMDDPDAEALEEYYEQERARAADGGGDLGGAGMWEGSGEGRQGRLGRTVNEDGKVIDVQVLPTLDGRGQLYDVGTGKEDGQVQNAGNRRKKQEKFETRDRQGNLLRYNADDDEQSLGELVRQERFGAGSGDQKNLDAEMATAITRDARFDDNLEYMDDNAERLAQRKRKSDAMKRAFAINDFARTKKALDSCPFCYQDDRQPLAAIVALGQRTYMCCTQFEELVPGHCLIVPLQHHLSTLEMEDDDWEEVRNFMKCLMRMHAKDNKGVLFFETILSFKQQRHTYIEAVPLPFDQFQDAPAYFRESILASESEWTQHKKLLDFSSRPGGFRRALVPNLPYFMVQWDYKGEKGYGHVIEGVETGGDEDVAGQVDEGDKGGGEFPKWFAAEIIGNLLGLEPRKWRKPRKMDTALNKDRAKALGTNFQPFNWTVQLQQE